MALPMRGVITYVYDLNMSTTCTTALKNTPNNRGLVPYHPIILAIRSQLFRAFQRFPTSSGQSSLATVNTRPRYL